MALSAPRPRPRRPERQDAPRPSPFWGATGVAREGVPVGSPALLAFGEPVQSQPSPLGRSSLKGAQAGPSVGHGVGGASAEVLAKFQSRRGGRGGAGAGRGSPFLRPTGRRNHRLPALPELAGRPGTPSPQLRRPGPGGPKLLWGASPEKKTPSAVQVAPSVRILLARAVPREPPNRAAPPSLPPPPRERAPSASSAALNGCSLSSVVSVQPYSKREPLSGGRSSPRPSRVCSSEGEAEAIPSCR